LETKAGRSSAFQSQLEEISEAVAAKIDGWSFAFLKELFVSFLLRIAHDRSTASKAKTASAEGSTIETVLLDQIAHLANQIIKIKEEEKDKQAEKAEKDKANPLAGYRVARPMTATFTAMPSGGVGF